MRCSVALVALLCASPALAQSDPALAEPVETEPPEVASARVLFEEGRARAEEERWEDALRLFRASLEHVERPSTLFNVAGCLVRLGRHVESIPVIERFLAVADPALDAADIAEARALLLASRQLVARLELHVEPPDATLEIDGEATEPGPVRRATLDPGVHVIRASAEGRTLVLREIALAEGATHREAVELPLREPIAAPAAVEPRAPEPPVEGEGRSFFETEVFWAVVGGVLGAAAFVGVAAGVAEATQPRPSGGSSGVVLIVLAGTF